MPRQVQRAAPASRECELLNRVAKGVRLGERTPPRDRHAREELAHRSKNPRTPGEKSLVAETRSLTSVGVRSISSARLSLARYGHGITAARIAASISWPSAIGVSTFHARSIS